MVAERFSDEELLQHLEGQLGIEDATHLEEALEANEALRERYERKRRFLETLRGSPDYLESIDVVAGLRKRMTASTSRRPLWVGAAAAVAVAASVAFFAIDTTGEFGAKGTKTAVLADTWSGIRIFEVDKNQESRPVRDRIGQRSSLVFSYTNIGPEPYTYLMIVGVDARGACYWYHPEYAEAETNPVSITIIKGKADVSLPDQIQHDLPVGPLQIHALFSRVPLSVKSIEAHFATDSAGDGHPPWNDLADQVTTLRVER